MSKNSFPFPFGLFPFFLAFHDRNVAIYGKVRKALRRPSRHRPLHFEPVDFFPLPHPQHHSRVMRRKIDWLEVKKKSTDRKSTRLNSSHITISYAVFCLKKKHD